MKLLHKFWIVYALASVAVGLAAGCRKKPEVFPGSGDVVAIQVDSKWVEMGDLRHRAAEFLARQGVSVAAMSNTTAFVYTDKGSNLVEFLYSTELGRPSFIVLLNRAGAVSGFTAGIAVDRTKMIPNGNSR